MRPVAHAGEVSSVATAQAREAGLPISVSARTLSWGIVITLGLLQAWSYRLLVGHDAVSYLDVADRYAKGGWRAGINGYWSPLYSWLLAFCLSIFGYSRQWESTVLHLINLAGYLCAYRSFEFFFKELMQTAHKQSRFESGLTSLPDFCWHALGLGLFLYSCLYMASVGGTTPDIFVVLFVCLAAGLLLRINSGRAGWKVYCGLGVALGLSYFAKTAMLPVSLVFLAVAVITSYGQRPRRFAFLLAPICFVLVVAPWVTALSRAKGHLSFGDSGRVAYAYYAGPEELPRAWGGVVANEEGLTHPPRRIWDAPPVVEFATPIPGTFPLWYESSYWLEGAKLHFSFKGQLHALRQSCKAYLQILNGQREYLALLVLLVIFPGAAILDRKAFFRIWTVWLPAAAGMVMYALVLVEPRYVAAFLLLFWLSLFAALRFPERETVQQFARGAVAVTVLATGIGLLRGAASDVRSILRPGVDEQSEVARGLRTLGLSDGQVVASLGTFRDSFEWARLAGLRIVSVVPSDTVNQYWFGTGDTRAKVNSLFARSGAAAIVTDTLPEGVDLPGWERVGKGSYFVFLLQTVPSGNGAR